MLYLGQLNRRTLICAVNQDPEESFKKTVEVDRLIDMLRDANPREVSKLVCSLRFISFHSWDPHLLTYSCSIFFHVNSCRSLLLKMSSLSMRAFGYDLLLELIPVNQRMIKHVFDWLSLVFLWCLWGWLDSGSYIAKNFFGIICIFAERLRGVGNICDEHSGLSGP